MKLLKRLSNSTLRLPLCLWIGERIVVGLRGKSDRHLLAWTDGAMIGSQSICASLRTRRVLGARYAVPSTRLLELAKPGLYYSLKESPYKAG